MPDAGHNTQAASWPADAWYVAPALRVRRLQAALVALAALGLAACGPYPRQDKDEPTGTYRVTATASFPGQQKLAKRSQLVIKVRNEENRKTIPNVAVTLRGFDTKTKQSDVADPNRPIFVINGRPVKIGAFPESAEAAPNGGTTAYVDTWALGTLRAGKTKVFKWTVTAVKAGPYNLRYRVAAGLNGKAKAVAVGGGPVRGGFKGEVSGTPPRTRVSDDGKTVIRGTR
jgi:hypothetical protein